MDESVQECVRVCESVCECVFAHSTISNQRTPWSMVWEGSHTADKSCSLGRTCSRRTHGNKCTACPSAHSTNATYRTNHILLTEKPNGIYGESLEFPCLSTLQINAVRWLGYLFDNCPSQPSSPTPSFPSYSLTFPFSVACLCFQALGPCRTLPLPFSHIWPGSWGWPRFSAGGGGGRSEHEGGGSYPLQSPGHCKKKKKGAKSRGKKSIWHTQKSMQPKEQRKLYRICPVSLSLSIKVSIKVH